MKLIPRKLLRLYQKFMVSLVKKIPNILLALDMGLGKTIIVLTALRDMFDSFIINKVLIVAPLFVAENTWPNEIKGWEHTNVMSYSVITGDEDERIAAIKKDVDIYIINKENLPWLYDYLRKIYVAKIKLKNKGLPKTKWDISGIAPVPFDVAVIDEASMLKSGNARTGKDEKKFEKEKKQILNRTDIDQKEKDKLVRQIEPSYSRTGVLYKMRPSFSRVIELSGTPSPNGLHDLWGLIYLLDGGIRLGTAKTKFLNRYFNYDMYKRKHTPHESSFSMIMNKLKDVMFSLNADDWISLPERIDNKVFVYFDDKEKKQYLDFKKTFYAEDFDVEAVNSGVLTNKLLQFCLSGDTEVLTSKGWLKITQIKPEHLIWDGIEWVTSDGCVFNGLQDTINCYGIDMTKGHKILTTEGWKSAGEIKDSESHRFERFEVRTPEGYEKDRNERIWLRTMGMFMRLRECCDEKKSKFEKCKQGKVKVLRLQPLEENREGKKWTRYEWNETFRDMARFIAKMLQSKSKRLFKLWGERYCYAKKMENLFYRFLDGCENRVRRQFAIGSQKQHEIIFSQKLSLGDSERESEKHQSERQDMYSEGFYDNCRSCGNFQSKISNSVSKVSKFQKIYVESERNSARKNVSEGKSQIPVYDLVNCGPRNRFVARGSLGPVIVHNCNGSMYNENREVLYVHSKKMQALEALVNESLGSPILIFYAFEFDRDAILKKFPNAKYIKDVKDVENKWNNGEIEILVAHPASAGHGLNLQKGEGHTCIWYGLCWSLEFFRQGIKRLHRSGQKNKVVNHFILVKDTVDEVVFETLLQKGSVQDDVTEAVRIEVMNEH